MLDAKFLHLECFCARKVKWLLRAKVISITREHLCTIFIIDNIVTDFMYALPGNGLVNTVQHARIERGYGARF